MAIESVYQPPLRGIPGRRTLKNFLATAMMPVGTTLNDNGGGWDQNDACANEQARTLGVSEEWVRFFRSQNMDYSFRDGVSSRSGLDCSGFLGWTLYNVINTENLKEGFVMKSTLMAKKLSEKGWGTWTQDIGAAQNHEHSMFLPGDVFSISGHVWISLGTCKDGSIPVLHSTAALSRSGHPGGGVELSALGVDEHCDAYRLSDAYMSRYYPQWYARYPVALKDYTQYTSTENEKAGKFSWDLTGKNGCLCDPDSYCGMTPEEILEDLFR